MTSTDQERWSRVKGRLQSRSRRRHFLELVRAHGPRGGRERDRPAVGADALPEELDPVALQRPRAELLAGRRRQRCSASSSPCARRCCAPTWPKPKRGTCRSAARNARRCGSTAASRAASTAPVSAAHDALGGSPLDPRLTFDTFVVGRSNTLAHAAAKQVAVARRGDVVMFNPLYIHAGVGLGKTHLLHAVTWAGNASGERKVLYLTAEKFMYGFVSALKTQTALAFKEALARHRRAGHRRPAIPHRARRSRPSSATRSMR